MDPVKPVSMPDSADSTLILTRLGDGPRIQFGRPWRQRYQMNQRSVIRIFMTAAVLASFALSWGCTRVKPLSEVNPVWTNFQLDASVFALAFEGSVLWVGTDRGVVTYDLVQDRILEQYDSRGGPDRGPLTDVVTCIRIDQDGNKWFGTHGGGLSKFDGLTWTHYSVPDLADPYIYDIVNDLDGRMWVANWRGVSILDPRTKRWTSYTTEDGIVDDWVYALALDQDGGMWLGTEGGVTQILKERFLSFSHSDGLGAALEKIGAYQRIENPSFHHQTTPGKSAEGYNPNYVLSAAVDQKNRKWFGTWGGGLARYSGKVWENFTVQDGLPGNFVSDLHVDRNGYLWATTDGGIGIFDGVKWTTLTTASGLIDDNVFAVAVDPQGSKWFGTLTGISKLEALTQNPT